MTPNQASELIELIRVHNELQKHRNKQLTALYNKLEDINKELFEIRCNAP